MILFIAIYVGVFCLLDFLYCTFIANSPYTFNPLTSLTFPVLLAVISYLLLFHRKKGK